MPRRDQASGFLRYDINDEDDLAALIKAGLIWKGGPDAVEKALRALSTGAVERPDNLPPEVAAWLDKLATPGSENAAVPQEPEQVAPVEQEVPDGPPSAE